MFKTRMYLIVLIFLLPLISCGRLQSAEKENEKNVMQVIQTRTENEKTLDDLELTSDEVIVIKKIIENFRRDFSNGFDVDTNISGKSMDTLSINFYEKKYLKSGSDYTYFNDGLFLNATRVGERVGCFRLTGYVEKNTQLPAKYGKNTFSFIVTKASEDAKKLLQEKSYKKENDEYILPMSIPNDFDPGYTILNSSKEDQIIVAVLLLEEPARGGYPDTVRVLCFQKESELTKKYIDSFTENDYSNYNDGI